MIRHIPSLIENKIERESLIDQAIKEQISEKHPYHKSKEEVEKERIQLLNRVKSSCSVFKASCPQEWESFEQDLVALFGVTKMLDRRSPYDFMGIQKEEGMPIDSNYWSLTKAYLSGQIEILESMFDCFLIDPKKIQPRKNVSFFRKVLTVLKFLLNRS